MCACMNVYLSIFMKVCVLCVPVCMCIYVSVCACDTFHVSCMFIYLCVCVCVYVCVCVCVCDTFHSLLYFTVYVHLLLLRFVRLCRKLDKALGCLDYFMERTWTVSGAAYVCTINMLQYSWGRGYTLAPHCTAVTCDCCSKCSVMSLWRAGLCRQVVA